MRCSLLLAALIAPFAAAVAQDTHAHDAIIVAGGTENWMAGPPSLPPGARLAVLEGDPAQPGPFTMRVSLPDGYTIPPHFHPGPEHVTVLKGTFLVGMGEKFDAAALKPLPAGSFGALPPGMRHFARAKGATLLQLHGVGPWGLTYVNPADDPRKKAS
jgi:quercetin dioxygenase-like cupin family protein